MLESVLKGFGVREITIIDSYDVKTAPKILKEALARPGFGVIISRRVCTLYGDPLKRRKDQSITPNFVDKKACNKYYACVREFYCPAISIDDAGQTAIARDLCDGCMCRSKLCPVNAIKSTEVPR